MTPEPIPATMSLSKLSMLITGGDNRRLMEQIAEHAELEPCDGPRYNTKQFIRAAHKYKSQERASDRRNIAHAELLELQAAKIREDWIPRERMEQIIGGIGAAFSSCLDEEDFPQSKRDAVIDSMEKAVEKALAEVQPEL